MAKLRLRGVTMLSGDLPARAACNENQRLLPDWMTPAELFQWISQEKLRLSREVAADASLWACPEHRREWDATLGIEQIALRQFGQEQRP